MGVAHGELQELRGRQGDRIWPPAFLPWPGIQPKRSEEIPHSPACGRLCFFLFPSSAYESKVSTLRMKTKKSPAFYAEDFLLVA